MSSLLEKKRRATPHSKQRRYPLRFPTWKGAGNWERDYRPMTARFHLRRLGDQLGARDYLLVCVRGKGERPKTFTTSDRSPTTYLYVLRRGTLEGSYQKMEKD